MVATIKVPTLVINLFNIGELNFRKFILFCYSLHTHTHTHTHNAGPV